MKRIWQAVLHLSLVAALLGLMPLARAECLPEPTAPSPEAMQDLLAKAGDHGFLWKLSKAGQTSWLYGTIHANRLEGLMPGPQTRQALLGSNALAIELDVSDPAVMQQIAQLAKRGAGQIPKAFQPRVQAKLDQLCLPAELMQHLHPTMLFSAMMMMDARQDGIEPGYGTEMLLVSVAKAGNKKIIGLETAAEQMAAILGPDQKIPTSQYEAALKQMESGQARTQLVKLVDAWNRADFAMLESYPEWCECMKTAEDRQAMRRLLDERNQIIAKRVAQAHRPDQSLFVAVGSLHMVGKKGLPVLLRQQGFTVERVEFTPQAAAQ